MKSKNNQTFIVPFYFSIYTIIKPITANITRTIRNRVTLFSIALLIITWSPFFTLFILFLYSLFSSSRLSNNSICLSSSILMYVDTFMAYYVSLRMPFILWSISCPNYKICWTCSSSLTTILFYFALFNLSYVKE